MQHFKPEDKYIDTKKLRGEVVVVVGYSDVVVAVQSLTNPQKGIMNIPLFYFNETFKKVTNGETELREKTKLTKNNVEDIMEVVDVIIRQFKDQNLIDEKTYSLICNAITFNIVKIFGKMEK